MEKKKVEIIDTHYNEVCDRLLLTEEQTRLLIYLEDMGFCDSDMKYRILDKEYEFKEI